MFLMYKSHQEDCEVWWLRTSVLLIIRGIVAAEIGPKNFGTFEKLARACIEIACSEGGFGGLSSVLPLFWIRCRLGELGREWHNVGGGGGRGRKNNSPPPPPPPSPIFLSLSHAW